MPEHKGAECFILPILEQDGEVRAQDYLRALNTRYALVSFPTRTIGGRNVGMATNYADRFQTVIDDARWSAQRIYKENELCFLVELRP